VNLTKISGKLKDQIEIFSGKVSTGLPKVGRRFVAEMLYGITSAQSVHLSQIARSLAEKIPLIKTINRLSFELSRRGLWEKLTLALLKLARDEIKADTLLILDLSDITKPYAREMEYLTRVHDGSRGELADGYWTWYPTHRVVKFEGTNRSGNNTLGRYLGSTFSNFRPAIGQNPAAAGAES
jgi:hypothetical protein